MRAFYNSIGETAHSFVAYQAVPSHYRKKQGYGSDYEPSKAVSLPKIERERVEHSTFSDACS